MCQHLERVAGSVLDVYQPLIREHVRARHGIYALYKRDRIYYVGLASDLDRRLKQHLKDRHSGRWDRFSVYLTIGDSHIKELESLILRIIKPSGNTQAGRFTRSEDLKRSLKRGIKALQAVQIRESLGLPPREQHATPSRRLATTTLRPLLGLRPTSYRIRVVYKGRTHTARVRRDGRIRYAGRLYDSPSAAGKALRRGKETNGWVFWQYERAPGDWVKLSALRRKIARRREPTP